MFGSKLLLIATCVIIMMIAGSSPAQDFTQPLTDQTTTKALWHFDSVDATTYKFMDDDSNHPGRNANLDRYNASTKLTDTTTVPTAVDPGTFIPPSDSSPVGYPGGNPAFGKCVYFDGINDQCQIANSSLPAIDGNNLTVQCWIRPDDAMQKYGDGKDHYWQVFDRWNQIMIWLKEQGSTSHMTLQALVYAQNSGSAVTLSYDYDTQGFNYKQWQHVRVAYPSGHNVATLYLNGNSVSTATLPAVGLHAPSQTTTYIGHRYAGGSDARQFWGFIDELRIDSVAHCGATHPWPCDIAYNGLLNPTISWTAGDGAVYHNIYFGTDRNAVTNAARMTGDLNGDDKVDFDDVAVMAGQWLTIPSVGGDSANIGGSRIVDFAAFAAIANNWNMTGAGIYKGYQAMAEINYTPGTLVNGTTYYWRIDEVNSVGTGNKGSVWSFTADPGQLLADKRFQRPMTILDTPLGNIVVIGTLNWNASSLSPIWQICQWASTDNFLTRTVTTLPDGSVMLAGTKKSLTFSHAGSGNAEADLIMAYNSNGEPYSQFAPCFYVAQGITDANGQFPKISQLSHLNYHIELKLIRDIKSAGTTTQFVQYFTVQNQNTASNEYGKNYSFGILFYDHRYSGLYQKTTWDYGVAGSTGVSWCHLPQNGFASGEINNGNWVTYDGDVLPYIKTSFNYLAANGGLPADANINDYAATSANAGWEMAGNFDSSMQLRNYNFYAVYP